jgi:peptidoglycan hydrolase-like protein with peptidoglycan-binding domain
VPEAGSKCRRRLDPKINKEYPMATGTKKSVGKISAKDYIAWVQRSLNRLLGVALITDGLDSSFYRDAVEEFQWAYGLPVSRDIDVADQNALIKANHLTPEYVAWAQESLAKVGAGIGLVASGTMNKATTNAIKSFQAYHGLSDDGWIGAKTETALIRESGILPPGHITRGPVPTSRPKRRPPTPRPVDPLPLDKRVDRMLSVVLYEALHFPSTYPDKKQRRRVRCLAYKLKRRSGIDMKFIPSAEATRFVNSTPLPRPYMLDKISISARDVFHKRVGRMSPADRTDPEKIRKQFLWLDADIVNSLGEIQRLYTSHGHMAHPFKKTPPGPANMLHKWAYDRQNGKTAAVSILACYK